MGVQRIVVAAVMVAIITGVALAAGGSGYQGTASYVRTSKGKSTSTGTTGVAGHGVFAGKLGGAGRSLLAGYAAAAGVPVGDVVKGGRYAVSWSSVKGKISGTIYARFKSAAAGSVCATYTSTTTTFDENFNIVAPHGSFKTIGGTGRGARTRLSGTFTVGKEDYHGEVNRTDTLNGKMASASGPARGLSTACKKLAKAAR